MTLPSNLSGYFPPQGQQGLFGEPPKLPELSQWHTPIGLARKLAQWIPPTARVIEPSAGAGNLVAALLERGHAPHLIAAIEIDPRWMEQMRQRFAGLPVLLVQADFTKIDHASFAASAGGFDVSICNVPFEGNFPQEFLDGLLKMCPRVCGIFKESVEFGIDRDKVIWKPLAKVTRRARLPQRVKYGGDAQASFDTVVLDLTRRTRPREDDELSTVVEEIWYPDSRLPLGAGESEVP